MMKFIFAMSPKILKITLNRRAKCSPDINIWNIFDNEHPPFMHGKRENGDGLDPSFVLFEKDNFNVTLDTQKMPFMSFIKRQSVMFHYADLETNTVYQYSTFHGILIAQMYSANECKGLDPKINEVFSDFKINIAFYLVGWKKILAPLINWYASKWIAQTWEEDLVMKERRFKFINLGFQDMKGLPRNVSERIGITQSLNLPLPKAQVSMLDHPLSYKNLRKNIFN